MKIKSIQRNLFDVNTKEYLYPQIETSTIILESNNESLYLLYFYYLEVPLKYHKFLCSVISNKKHLTDFTAKDLQTGVFTTNTINQYLSDLWSLGWIKRTKKGEYQLKENLVFNNNKLQKLIIEIN